MNSEDTPLHMHMNVPKEVHEKAFWLHHACELTGKDVIECARRARDLFNEFRDLGNWFLWGSVAGFVSELDDYHPERPIFEIDRDNHKMVYVTWRNGGVLVPTANGWVLKKPDCQVPSRETPGPVLFPLKHTDLLERYGIQPMLPVVVR